MDELVQLMENVFKPVLSSFEPNVRLCRFYKDKTLFSRNRKHVERQTFDLYARAKTNQTRTAAWMPDM